MILSGWQYGGYTLNDKTLEVTGETEEVAIFKDNVYNVNGWLYSTNVSVTPDVADFVWMK